MRCVDDADCDHHVAHAHSKNVEDVHLSLSMGFAILFEAALSFLGLGVQSPDPSWGSMLGRATQFMESDPLVVMFPGIAILLTVLSFNVLGDAVNGAIGCKRCRTWGWSA